MDMSPCVCPKAPYLVIYIKDGETDVSNPSQTERPLSITIKRIDGIRLTLSLLPPRQAMRCNCRLCSLQTNLSSVSSSTSFCQKVSLSPMTRMAMRTSSFPRHAQQSESIRSRPSISPMAHGASSAIHKRIIRSKVVTEKSSRATSPPRLPRQSPLL